MGWLKKRPLTALQVEVTSRCTRRCAICPRTPLRHVWRDGDLSDADWTRLREDLSLARHVHLQGWGEPLLHPRLAEMVDAAKAAGCTVGLTTNADLLLDAVAWIVAGGVDQVTVSVAGETVTHAALRDGSRLEHVWAAVERLIAGRRRGRQPKVQVSYLLTRSNMGQLPALVRQAARAGADAVFVTHIECTPSPELRDEAAFEATGLRAGVREAVTEAERTARSVGIAFRAPALAAQEMLVCALDPQRFVFVSWDGRVGPCVNLLLPVCGSIPRVGFDGTSNVQPEDFGRLGDHALREILSGRLYRSFVATFESRLAAERLLLDAVGDSLGSRALERLEQADRRRTEVLAENPFPASCAGCHKVNGW